MFETIDSLHLPNQSPLYQEFLKNENWRFANFGYSLINLDDDFEKRSRVLEKREFDYKLLGFQIEKYMQPFGLSEKTKSNLDKFQKSNCVCVVTGQQPSLFGGPIYNFYKVITAIKLARQWEEKTNIPCVPVFWNASNDHDLEEGNRFFYLDKHRRLAKTKVDGLPNLPLDKIKVGNAISQMKAQIEKEMGRIDFLSDAWNIFLPDSNDTIGTWQTRILNHIFKDKGLLIVEPHIFKHQSKKTYSHLLPFEDQFIKQIQLNSTALKNKNFHVQVDEKVSSRFMMYQANKGRYRLQKQSDHWVLGNQRWGLSELLSEVEKEDVDVSPDALLRPIWQDMNLPVAAYVAGPGEIAYYHQLKGCYEIFGMQMPLIVPRISGSIFEKNHLKFLGQFKVPIHHFFELYQWGKVPTISSERPSDALSGLFLKWGENAKTPSEIKIFKDFQAKAEKMNRKYYDKLEASRMNINETGNKQLQEWKDFLYPRQQYQERIFSVLPFYARHGPSFLNFLDEAKYEFGKHFMYSVND